MPHWLRMKWFILLPLFGCWAVGSVWSFRLRRKPLDSPSNGLLWPWLVLAVCCVTFAVLTVWLPMSFEHSLVVFIVLVVLLRFSQLFMRYLKARARIRSSQAWRTPETTGVA